MELSWYVLVSNATRERCTRSDEACLRDVCCTMARGARMHVTKTPTEASTAMNHHSSPEQSIAGSARK